VLDACAAPGNKSTQILEQAPGVRLTALDASARRMDTLRAQIARQGVTAHTVVADATDVDAWWSGTPFDAILLDAPCSATGTLRRHPDIKVRLTAHDVDALCARQRALLTALWRTLAPGGRLVYCTCSLLPAENEQVIAHFLCEHPDAVLAPAPIDVGLDRGHGRLLLPQQDGPDGFFLALLRRQA
jgi:16S rRNA (cytosine967-C5)-methyltransferase